MYGNGLFGDIADGSCIVEEEDDFMALSEVKTPIVFTSGNHDYYLGFKTNIILSNIQNIVSVAETAQMLTNNNSNAKTILLFILINHLCKFVYLIGLH